MQRASAASYWSGNSAALCACFQAGFVKSFQALNDWSIIKFCALPLKLCCLLTTSMVSSQKLSRKSITRQLQVVAGSEPVLSNELKSSSRNVRIAFLLSKYGAGYAWLSCAGAKRSVLPGASPRLRPLSFAASLTTEAKSASVAESDACLRSSALLRRSTSEVHDVASGEVLQ